MRAAAMTALATLVCGCGESSGGADAAIDAGEADAAADAGEPDASGPCAGQLLFTGGYVDWDSSDQAFDGVEFATWTEVADAQNTATTAPNGRGILCLPLDARSAVDFTHPDYLDLRYTVDPEAAAMGAFEVRGLTPARADQLFADDLGVARDADSAQVLVAARTYPGGAPAAGATVSLGNAHQGAFTDDGTGAYATGDTLAGGAFVLFANVEVGPGQTTVTVDGVTCVGPSTLDLMAGGLSVTTFACAP